MQNTWERKMQKKKKSNEQNLNISMALYSDS